MSTASHSIYHKDRTIMWALAVSILIHAVVLLPQVKNMLLKNLNLDLPEEVYVEPLEFELVSPPDRPIPTDQASRYLSTVSSAASDMVDTKDKTDLPHGEGVVPFPDQASVRDGAEGGGDSELPPLPEETTDLGEAFKRSKFLSEISPRRDLSLPDRNPDFKNEASARASIGGITINTTAWDFAPYLLDLKHRIKQHWIPPLAFTALGSVHGYTWVRFRVYPDGSLHQLEVIETEGHESLHRASANAVRGAAPFRPLPDDFPEDYLDVTFGFYYLLPGDEDRFFGKE